MSRGALRAAVFLFCFTLVLFAANLVFTAREVNNAKAADAVAVRAAASVRQLCLAGNEARAQQITLWDHLITIAVPPPHETRAAQRKRLAVARAFDIYIHQVFKPRDCAHPLTLAP